MVEFGLGVCSAKPADSAVSGGPGAKVSVFMSQGFYSVQCYQLMFVLETMALEGHQKLHCLYHVAMAGVVDALWVA